MTKPPIRILFVEDDVTDQVSVERFVRKFIPGFVIETVAKTEDAIDLLQTRDYDVALIDYRFRDGTALDLLQKLGDTPAIFLTGTGQEEIAAMVVGRGAYDFLVKDANRNYLTLLPVTIQKVLARRNAEIALRESEIRCRDLIENVVLDMYFCISEAGVVLLANRSGASQIGYTPSELLGQSFLNLVMPGDLEKVKHFLLIATMNTEQAHHAQFRIAHKTGRVVYASAEIRAQPGAGKRLPVIRVLARDITEVLRKGAPDPRKVAPEPVKAAPPPVKAPSESSKTETTATKLTPEPPKPAPVAAKPPAAPQKALTTKPAATAKAAPPLKKLPKAAPPHPAPSATDGGKSTSEPAAAAPAPPTAEAPAAAPVAKPVEPAKKAAEMPETVPAVPPAAALAAERVLQDRNPETKPAVIVNEWRERPPVMAPPKLVGEKPVVKVPKLVASPPKPGKAALPGPNHLGDTQRISFDEAKAMAEASRATAAKRLMKPTTKVPNFVSAPRRHVKAPPTEQVIPKPLRLGDTQKITIEEAKQIAESPAAKPTPEIPKPEIAAVPAASTLTPPKSLPKVAKPIADTRNMAVAPSPEAPKPVAEASKVPVTPPAAAPAVAPSQGTVEITEELRGTEKLLVVDDIPEQRAIAARMLAKMGYRVVTADGGKAAIEMMKQAARGRDKSMAPFDLVVMDMSMGEGMDGFETYRQMAKFFPGQRCILMSGSCDADRVRKTQELGAGQFVAKPYTFRAIGFAVRKELDKKS